CDGDGVLDALAAVQAERVDEIAPDQLGLLVAGQLEDALAGGEHASIAIAHDEARAWGGVVVVHELEQEPEPAALTRGGLVEQTLAAVVVDRPALAVRADEVRHAAVRTRREARRVRR